MGQDGQIRQGENPEVTPPDDPARKLLEQDIETESRLVWSEIGIIAFVTLLVSSYLILLS